MFGGSGGEKRRKVSADSAFSQKAIYKRKEVSYTYLYLIKL